VKSFEATCKGQGKTMIAINWGTSNFRAYKLDAAGNVEAEKSSGRGAVQVPTGGFLDALMAEVGDWVRAGETRVLMSGMVGARNGWKEAGYVAVPATFEQVVTGVIRVEVDAVDVRIVPGLIGADECGVPEVMRGEETEIFGCKSELAGSSFLCLPGTHTKWVRVQSGKIASFSTSMTGDLFKAVREGTILRTCAQHEANDNAAFLSGVARSREPGDLAHHLFGVRTLVLTGKMQEQSASSYLSGLLIGHEVKAMTRAGDRVHLIGDSALCMLYADALRESEVESTVEPAGAALRGLVRIAGSLAW
jgi:2-dehydro-3-deoxygalactonokinase